MTNTDELLMILDIANSEGRLTDLEYCRAVEILIGDEYPIDLACKPSAREWAEYEYNVDYAEEN